MGAERRPCAAKAVGINIIMDCNKNCPSSVGDDNGRCCQDVAIKRYLSKAALVKRVNNFFFGAVALGSFVAVEERKEKAHTNWD